MATTATIERLVVPVIEPCLACSFERPHIKAEKRGTDTTLKKIKVKPGDTTSDLSSMLKKKETTFYPQYVAECYTL